MYRLASVLFVSGLVACIPEDPGNATFSTRGSVNQVHVWKTAPASTVELKQGEVAVASGTSDEQGSLVFRNVAPGAYRVHVGAEYSAELDVMSVEGSAVPREFYEAQKLVPGFQYLTMRDGTQLSAYVTMPGPADEGPYPTVVNYSGYDPSKPGEPIDGLQDLCGSLPVLCDAPNSDSLFSAFIGYATVNVNIRGTGCSGGAYDYFETLQLLDGYDVIETVAAQPWVLHNKVGMVGLSYPGITQLFVAKMRPPGLAAITPLSVIGNTSTTLFPGGILNDGFALNWVDSVLDKAKPYGQGWERARVDAGDTVCEENQLLHSQRVDNVAQARNTPFYDPMLSALNPETFVDEIEVPVFLASAWHDEQTGPFFGVLLDRFTSAPAFRATVYNGVHSDAYAPAVLVEMFAFLDLFVAKRVPAVPSLVRTLAPALFDEVFGVSMNLPEDRFTSYTDHAAALAAWKSEPTIRLLFESGAGDAEKPGAPIHTFEKTFPAWPPPTQRAARYYLQPDGTLADTAPAATFAASEFTHEPESGQRVIIGPGGGIWSSAPDYVWPAPASGLAVVFDSAVLASDLVMAGTGSVDLWIRSTATEADLEATLSELRPDGQEMYVQSGWLRASQRRLADDATVLYPAQTRYEEHHAPLVPGEWTQARLAIAPFAHAFRAGSRLRLTIDTPGGSRAEWKFALAPVPAGTKVAVGHDAVRASSVALPVLEGVAPEGSLPACTLRGQQCRAVETYDNAEAVE